MEEKYDNVANESKELTLARVEDIVCWEFNIPIAAWEFNIGDTLLYALKVLTFITPDSLGCCESNSCFESPNYCY